MRKKWEERRERQIETFSASGVQESLMDVNNPPNGRNTIISSGMKGMPWEVVCRGVPEVGEVSEAGGVQQ